MAGRNHAAARAPSLEEFALIRDEMGFDDERIATLARDSWTYSGAPDELKAEGIRRVDAWLAASL